MTDVDLSLTITPKSDQLNADDLITGPRTITVTRVTTKKSSVDQPTSIYFEGDDGKPYKPCLSMRRVLVQCWGKDGDAYAGRSMTLYCDPNVAFGGQKVGGIRISHMSHIDGPKQLALTVTRGKKAAYTVKPLSQAAGKSAGADVRKADGAQGESRSPPADDFPGDRAGFKFTITTATGEARETADGDKWCGALVSMFAKARDAEAAQAAWARNAGNVAAAEKAGHEALALTVREAAHNAGVEVE